MLKRDNKGTKDSANAAAESDEAWAVIIDVESEGEADIKPEVELYNSGAFRHMSPLHHRFINFQPIPHRPITAANNRTFYTISTGDL